MTASAAKRSAKRAPPQNLSVAETIKQASARQRAGQSYGEIGAALKAIIEQRRRTILNQYARGDIAAKRLAAVMDEAIIALLQEGAAANSGGSQKLAVCAVGGFGRRLLAPHSDIDLLFLYAGDEAEIRPLLDFMLYPLWDAGLKVGHAVHTPASAVNFCQTDFVARTAFLDSRYLGGSEPAYRDFQKRFDKLRKRTKKQFLAAKIEERKARHESSEQSRYLSEPDLKEGKGGLRDLHTIRWLYRYEYDREIDDPKAQKKMLSADDLKAFQEVRTFLVVNTVSAPRPARPR